MKHLRVEAGGFKFNSPGMWLLYGRPDEDHLALGGILDKGIKDLVIPSEMLVPDESKPLPIVSLGDPGEGNPFGGCSEIESITIPVTITDIVDKVDFSVLPKLKRVIYEGTPEQWAMVNLHYQPNAPFYKNKNKDAEFIVAGAPLVDMVIPYGATMVPDFCLSGYKKLQSLRIPVSVRKIGRNAIEKCKGMKVFYEGSAAQWEQVLANSNSTCKLAKCDVTCESDVDVLTLKVSGMFTSYDLDQLKWDKLESIEFEEGVKVISGTTFYHFEKLKRVKFPKSLKRIVFNPFEHSPLLEQVEVPAETKFDPDAFHPSTKVVRI